MTKGAQQKLIRTLNDTLVCELLMHHGPLTRTDIANRAQLTVPAALKIIDRLLADGLVIETPATALSTRPGPKASLFALDPGAAIITSAHIDLDYINVTHRLLDGTLHSSRAHHFDPQGDIAAQISHATTSPIPEVGHSIAIALPGVVNQKSGDVIQARNIPTWTKGTASRIRALTGATTVFDNDVNFAAVAEHSSGVAQGCDDFLLVSFGSGIGAALVMDGHVRTGSHGAAGEIGYAPVQSSGGMLTFQDHAGAWMLAHSFGLEHSKDFAWLTELAERNDPAVWEAFAQRFCPALLAMAALLDPELIVLSGEISRRAGTPLLAAVQEWMTTHSELASPTIAISTLGDQAMLEGGFVRAWRAHITAALD